MTDQLDTPRADAFGQPQESRRSHLVANAIKTWVAQLVDLGGRNNLLHYRDLRLSTVDIGGAPAGSPCRGLFVRPSRNGQEPRLLALSFSDSLGNLAGMLRHRDAWTDAK